MTNQPTNNEWIEKLIEKIWYLKRYSDTRYFDWEEVKKELKKLIIDNLPKPTEVVVPVDKPSECKCKWWRHCEVCRKADYVWAGIERLIYVLDWKRPLNTPLTYANMSRIAIKINEIIDRINKQ